MVNTSLIPQPSLNNDRLYENGKTQDIIDGILSVDKYLGKGLGTFAKQFRKGTIIDTCRDIWSFTRYRIKYEVDPEGIQNLQAPSRLWHTKRGDCKSKSMFIAGLLQNLGIKYRYRFTTYTPGSRTATHIYVIATDEQGKDVIIDSVYSRFNAEKKPTYIKDIKPPMAQINYLSGFVPREQEPDTIEIAGIGRFSFKKVMKAVAKVATFPQRTAVKGILEVTLPKAAPIFLYLFIKDRKVLDKLSPKMKKKYNKAVKIKKFITDTIGMKESHFMGLIRKGIKRQMKAEPEIILQKQFKAKVSGIGVLPLMAIGPAVAALGKLLDIIMKAFGKKGEGITADEAPDASDVADVSPEVAAELARMKPNTAGEANIDKEFGAAPGQSSNTMLYIGGAIVGAVVIANMMKSSSN